MSQFTVNATQNSSYGYGYGASGYGYGYGYWTESSPTLAITYQSTCTSSCSYTAGTTITITATFGSASSGIPDINIDLPGTGNDVAYTAMTQTSSTVYTYSFVSPSSTNATGTVNIRTMGGFGYTPTPSNNTFALTYSGGGGGGGGGATTSETTDETAEKETATEATEEVTVADGETVEVNLAEANQVVTMSLGATVSFSVAGGSHSLAISSIDFAAGTAVITVSSDPIDLNLAEGESQYVDINSDGVNDLLVTLDEVISETELKLTIAAVVAVEETVAEETAAETVSTGYTPVRSATVNTVAETEGVNHFISLTKNLPTGSEWSVVHFIAYGTSESSLMSVRDRKGVIGDYFEVYSRVPTTENDWQDVALILTSHKPHQRNIDVEKQALVEFIKVYKRLPDFSNVHDEWATYYIGYKIRNVIRNIDAEKAAIGTFRSVYKYVPSTSHQWAIMRAIGYSGASR